jgi:hypothetical protein
MPQQISLTRYRIYNFTDTPTKAPSLWKVFGSNDGNTFTEITAASQTTRLTSYTNNYYEKVVSGTSALYSYICVNQSGTFNFTSNASSVQTLSGSGQYNLGVNISGTTISLAFNGTLSDNITVNIISF